MVLELVALFVCVDQLLLLYLELDVFSLEVLHPGCTVGNSEVVASVFKDAMALFDHLRNVDDRIIGTHKGVNSGFIDKQVKRLVGVCHLAYVHDVVSHTL